MSFFDNLDTEFIQFGNCKVNDEGAVFEGLKYVDPPKRLTHCGVVYEFLQQSISFSRGPLEGERFYCVKDLLTDEVCWVSDSRKDKLAQCMIPFEMRNEPFVIF